ncbi:MAG: hypothetical protein NTV01_11795 [Bacteroidia bacterium]|nr:hypothetical protein [Bacteroidia bacterium]
MDDNLYKAFTGSEIEVILLQGELEENGISTTTRYGSTFGVNPCYGGAPIELDLLINHWDLEKATPIIQEFLQNRN